MNFDALGQYELGASGIAAAILRGAALASQRLHTLSSAKAAGGDECSAVSTLATITHKDFEDAARAQVGHDEPINGRRFAFANQWPALRICMIARWLNTTSSYLHTSALTCTRQRSQLFAAFGDGKRVFQICQFCVHLIFATAYSLQRAAHTLL